ncbi:MAG: type IV pilus biogenesis/stability protein PilW [Pseudomonadota bacterium]
MRNQIIIVSLIIYGLFHLTGCDGVASSNKNIKPSQSTNEVALSNLDLGIAYMKQGAFEKALEKLNRAKLADPKYSPTYNALGLLYESLGQQDKAEEHYKKAIKLNIADSSTLNNYGRFLCKQNRRDEAEDVFQQAADNPLYETPEIAITNAGVCFFNNQNSAKAEEYFRKALQLNPNIPPALLLMSEISYNQGDKLSARGYLQRFQLIAAHTPKSLWLGIRLEQALKNNDAVSSYALLLKNQFPDSEEAAKLRQSGIR